MGANAPVVWNAPSAPFAGGTKGARANRPAIRNHTSYLFVPMGLTGAPWDLLSDEERKREIEWSTENPWATGCVDSRFGNPGLVAGRAVPGSEANPAGIIVACITETLSPSRGTVISAEVDGVNRVLPVLPISDFDTAQPARSLKRWERNLSRHRRSDSLHGVLLLEVRSAPDVEHLGTALQAVCELRQRKLADLVRLAPPAEWPETPEPITFAAAVHAPDLHAAIHATRVRKQRKTRANTRELLETLAWGGALPTSDGKRQLAAARQRLKSESREFVASMMGDISLAGSSFDACFSSGRFCGFSIASDGFGPTITRVAPAGPHLREMTFAELEPATCFSFDSANSRGVRVVCRAPGSVFACDYSFVLDFPVLVCTAAVVIDPAEVSAASAWPSAAGSGFIVHHLVAESGRMSQSRVSGPAALAPRFDMRVDPGTNGLRAWYFTRDGLPLALGAGVLAEPSPAIVFGGAFTLRWFGPRQVPGRPAAMAAEYAVILAPPEQYQPKPGEWSGHDGKLPSGILRELASGPRPADLIRMLETPPGPVAGGV